MELAQTEVDASSNAFSMGESFDHFSQRRIQAGTSIPLRSINERRNTGTCVGTS